MIIGIPLNTSFKYLFKIISINTKFSVYLLYQIEDLKNLNECSVIMKTIPDLHQIATHRGE